MMRIKEIFTFTALTVMLCSALLAACAEPAKPLTPAFQVVSLRVSPEVVETGREVTVTAEVQNTGNIEGNYQAVLSVNDEKLPAKLLTIAAGDIGSVTFIISRDKPGHYDLTMGRGWATLEVKKYIDRQSDLYYGSPDPIDFLFAGANSGHLIDFTPANSSFTLNKISICGGIYGSAWHGKSFELFVLSKNLNVVFSQTMPITVFPQREHRLYQLPVWREFEVDPINLPEKFYIYVYTNTARLSGLHLGVDNSIVNEHSDVATGKPPQLNLVEMATLYPGLWCADRSKVNWMIQATGTVRVPE